MGVVRREGDWRLNKREEGRYEITYHKESQAEVRTPEYRPVIGDEVNFGLVPVHDVESYAEAEGLFEEYAHSGTAGGVGGIQTGSANKSRVGHSDPQSIDAGALEIDDGLFDELENLPPGGLSVVLLLGGGIILSGSTPSLGQPVFLLGVGLAVSGAVILGWAMLIGNRQDWGAAIEFLTSTDPNEGDSGTSDNAAETVDMAPPTSESLKNELIFGRAEQRCEWCDTGLDNPEVHHIKPRSEGGRNDKSNLVVLCPTCHRKADNGGISRTKLRGKLRHIQNG